MEYRASASTLSRKLSSDFAGKSMYDGVFAAPTKCTAADLSSPVEDYREIFGGGDGSRGSSIPVLDVPELRERKVSVDVRSSNLDYADIFGGFGDSDYAVPLEELIAKPRKGRSSSKEACTPAYSTSPSDGSNPSNCSQENQSSPCEASCQSFEDVKQFNMLYHKTNQGSKNGTNGRTHIAQLHAVPGYTRLIDETAPLQRNQDDSPVTSVGSDMHFNVHCGDGTTEGKYSQKSMSGLPPGGTNKLTSEGGVKTQKKSMRDKSFSSDILFDINNFGLGTDPPKVPLPSSLSSSTGNSDLDSKGSVASKFEGSAFDASDADAGASSPPYFGEEVDKNSVAAASAAAVKLAIEKAQARMKLAKELMERKKGGRHSREKVSGVRAEKKRGEKVSGKTNILKNEMAQEICDKVDTPIELTAWMKKKNTMKVGEVNPDSGDKKELFSTKEAAGGMQRQELKTAHADHMLGEMKEPETEEMFSELVRTGKHNTMTLEVEEPGHVNKNMSSTKGREQEEIGMADSTVEEPEDNGIKYKAEEDVCNKEDSEKKPNASEGGHELEACDNTMMSCQQIHDQEVEKKLEVLQEHEETEKEVNIPHEQDECDEKQKEPLVSIDECYEKQKEPLESIDECYEKQKEPLESMGISENVDAQELEEEKSMRLEEAHERTENDKKIEEAKEQEECVNIHEMVTEVRGLENNFGLEENGKRLDGSCGREENEKETEESCRWQENEKQQKEAESEEKLEKSGDQVHKQEMVGERFINFDEGEESDEYFEDSKSEENEKLDEGEENEKEINESCQILEDEVRQEEACEWADTAEIWTEINQREEEEEEKTVETLKCHKNNFEAADDTCKHDEHQHLSETKETAGMQKEIDKHMESTSEATVHEEDASIMEASTSYFEARDNEKGSESVEVRNDLDYNEIFDTNGMTDGALELDEMIKQMKEANEALFFNANGGDSGKAEISLGKKENDQYASGIVFNLEKHFNGLVCELGENDKSVKEAELSSSHEENGNNLKTAHEERWVHSGEVEAAHQQPSTSDRREKTTEIDQEFYSSPEIIKENHHETLIIEERETKYTWQEVDLEKEHTKNLDEAKDREKEHSRKLDEAKEKEQEHNRKLDEAKEKEKEKEKERIAVERVIREARERAFAEARDRAAMEKLTSGAKRRPMTEARERLGKASVEANLQSSADKEAKLKAERAAVERATAEARDRALEKAKSGKAASDARNQAEKYAGGSKDDGMRHSFPSDTQFRASGPSSSSRSSNQGERSEGANSELAQRFKAEWERQQRTAERAAKALAEKNMRDLLAQKEQAERNRLAEPLDADIKRWSSGKEGNLRALLSTLQYILGPDSGWQPVPLTDIIATAAVKKTYRRATLFVHPDKLQQRGASIQQKYMCEKVFDLLKEAWDKFNREEW